MAPCCRAVCRQLLTSPPRSRGCCLFCSCRSVPSCSVLVYVLSLRPGRGPAPAAEVITKYRRQPSNAACPVHFEAHAADERGFGAGQIEHGVGDVECGGKASQRDGGQELGAAGLVD